MERNEAVVVSNKFDPRLESEEDFKKRWRSIYVIYFTVFLMSLGFSIVLTGIWPFLDKLDPEAGKEFMGYIVAANPLGQTIFSPLVGYWSNKLGSIRMPMLCSLAVFTMASIMYSSLEAFPSHHKYWMFGARALIGIASANIAVCRSYISAATRLGERTHAVSMISLAQVLGFIVGPAIQAAVTPLGDKGFVLLDTIQLDMYTACGWINGVLTFLNFFLFLPAVFQEKKIAAKEIMILQGRQSERETWKSIKPDRVGTWTLIAAFFVLVFNFVLLETLGTSLTMDQFAWTKEQALWYMGILMAVGGVIACVTFVLIGPLCRRFDEVQVLLWGGFFLMVVGRALHIPMGSEPPQMALNKTELAKKLISLDLNITKTFENVGCSADQEWCRTTPALTISQFIIGYAATSVGYPIGVTLIQTIFSKILGPRPQGTWMGLMTGSGSLSRVMGPVFVGLIYVKLGTYWTFGFTSVMMMVSMVWLWCFRHRLVPPDLDKPAVELRSLSNGVRLEEQRALTTSMNK